MTEKCNSFITNQLPEDILQLFQVVPGAAERYRQLVDKSNNTVNWIPNVIQDERNSPVWNINSGARQSPIRKPTPGYFSCPLWQETAKILTRFQTPRTFDWETMDLTQAEKEQLTIIERLLLESRAMSILFSQMNPSWSSSSGCGKVSRSVGSLFEVVPQNAPESLPVMATPLDRSIRHFFGCEPANQQTGTPFDVEPVMKTVVKNMLEMRATLTQPSTDNAAATGAGNGAASQTVEYVVIGGPAIDPKAPEHGCDDSQAMGDDDASLVNRDSEPTVVDQSSHRAQTADVPEDQTSEAPGISGQVDSDQTLKPVTNNDQEDLVVMYNDVVHKNQKPEALEDSERENSELQDYVAIDDTTSAHETAANRKNGTRNVEVVGKALAVVDHDLEPMLEDFAFDDEVAQMILGSPDSESSGLHPEEDSLEEGSLEGSSPSTAHSTVDSKSLTPDRSPSTSSCGSSNKSNPLRKERRNRVGHFIRARDTALLTQIDIPMNHPAYPKKLEQLNLRFQDDASVFQEEIIKSLKSYLRTYMLVPGDLHEFFPMEKNIYPPTSHQLWNIWNKQKPGGTSDYSFSQIESDDARFKFWLDLEDMVRNEVLFQIEEGFVCGQKRRKGVRKERKRAVPSSTMGTFLSAAGSEAQPNLYGNFGLAPTPSPMAPNSRKRVAPWDATGFKKTHFNTSTKIDTQEASSTPSTSSMLFGPNTGPSSYI